MLDPATASVSCRADVPWMPDLPDHHAGRCRAKHTLAPLWVVYDGVEVGCQHDDGGYVGAGQEGHKQMQGHIFTGHPAILL